MALKTVPNGIPYVSRKRIFVDSHNATSNRNTDGGEVWDNATFTDNLSEPCFEVASVELTGYSVQETISAPFPQPQSQNGRWPGARYLDMRVQYLANTLDFTVEMPYVREERRRFDSFVKRNAQATLYDLAVACSTAMYAAGGGAPWTDIIFATRTNEFFSDGSRGATVLVPIHQPTSTDCTVTYFFASGANAGNTPHLQLGFDQAVDVGGAPTVQPDLSTATWPIPDRMANFYQQRYLNVSVDQLQTHFDPFPHARIFLGNAADFVSTARKPVERPRLITNGPKRLTAITIRLTLDQGRPINPLYNYGADFTYDVLQNVPELQPGVWSTQQSFVY